MPAYRQTDTLEGAHFVIADADQAGTLDAVLAADRVADTVFIGSLAPEGALAWMMRPIDALQVLRELDAAVALRRSQALAAAPPAPPAKALDEAPLQAALAAPVAVAAAQRGPARRADDVSAPTAALLVDDSEIALRLLERQLQALGMRTETALHSQRALELMAHKRYDVVFLEVDLGPHSELDGLALRQKKRLRLPIY